MRRKGLAFEFFDESFRQGEQSLSLSLDFVDVLNDHDRTFDRGETWGETWGRSPRRGKPGDVHHVYMISADTIRYISPEGRKFPRQTK